MYRYYNIHFILHIHTSIDTIARICTSTQLCTLLIHPRRDRVRKDPKREIVFVFGFGSDGRARRSSASSDPWLGIALRWPEVAPRLWRAGLPHTRTILLSAVASCAGPRLRRGGIALATRSVARLMTSWPSVVATYKGKCVHAAPTDRSRRKPCNASLSNCGTHDDIIGTSMWLFKLWRGSIAYHYC